MYPSFPRVLRAAVFLLIAQVPAAFHVRSGCAYRAGGATGARLWGLQFQMSVPVRRHKDNREGVIVSSTTKTAADESVRLLEIPGAKAFTNELSGLQQEQACAQRTSSEREETSRSTQELRTLVRDETTSAAAGLDTAAAVEAGPYFSQTHHLEEESAAGWMDDLDPDGKVNSAIESLVDGVKSTATTMEVVPVKRRRGGRLDIDGQGLLNLRTARKHFTIRQDRLDYVQCALRAMATLLNGGPPTVHQALPSTMLMGLLDVYPQVTSVPRLLSAHLSLFGAVQSILVFSALWAIHTIVTVDATMWRGWTLQETLMRLPWANWDNYEMGLLEHPIITKTAINLGIYLIGDWLSQINYGRDEDVELWEFDLARTLRNGFIGALFGPVAHFYYDFSDHILPPNVGMNRPIKIAMDQTIYFVSKCTIYISLVSLLRGDSLGEAKKTVDSRLKGVVTTGWRFWPFVHVLTYFVIPPRHRVLWVSSVDLLWSSILAGMTSGNRTNREAEAEAEAQVQAESRGAEDSPQSQT